MYNLTPDQKIICKTIREYVQREIIPVVLHIEETGSIPDEVIHKMSKPGFFGLLIPEIYCGTYVDELSYYLVINELSKACPALALTLVSHSLCCHMINKFGNENQKRIYLPKLASGEYLGANAMTEPDAGSDLGSLKTFAEQKGDHFLLNGSKHFITNGTLAKVVIVLAATTKKKTPFQNSLFILEKGTDGFSLGRQEKKMGFKGSDTRELFFDNVCMPLENLLGAKGNGTIEILNAIESSRLAVASMALGIAEAAFEHAVRYSKERKQFGQRICNFEMIQSYIAEMATKIECCRLLITRASELQAFGRRITKEAAMAKYFCTESALEITSKALQIFGGYGYMKDLPLEKYFRDARLCTIIEGTSEIQKLIIAKNL